MSAFVSAHVHEELIIFAVVINSLDDFSRVSANLFQIWKAENVVKKVGCSSVLF